MAMEYGVKGRNPDDNTDADETCFIDLSGAANALLPDDQGSASSRHRPGARSARRGQ
jgi:hypothetical protein